ncbi:MAG: DUF4013 domain-containing protein [Blastopirellula sp. JB062]
MSNDPNDPNHSSPNPFESPSQGAFEASHSEGEAVAQRTSLDYFGPFSQFFEHSNWTTNMLLPALVLIIPILGVMVVWGYMFEVIALQLTGKGERPYQGYSFDRFGEHLMRGLWFFLAMFCLGFVLSIPLILVVFILQLVAQNAGGSIGALLGLAIFFIQFGAQILINLVAMPAMIRVGLSKDFSEAFKFDFILDFVQKMWIDQVLVSLFLAISGMVVIAIGLVACCIGVYPAAILMMFVATMLNMQLYQVYLHRGGQTVPINF